MAGSSTAVTEASLGLLYRHLEISRCTLNFAMHDEKTCMTKSTTRAHRGWQCSLLSGWVFAQDGTAASTVFVGIVDGRAACFTVAVLVQSQAVPVQIGHGHIWVAISACKKVNNGSFVTSSSKTTCMERLALELDGKKEATGWHFFPGIKLLFL